MQGWSQATTCSPFSSRVSRAPLGANLHVRFFERKCGTKNETTTSVWFVFMIIATIPKAAAQKGVSGVFLHMTLPVMCGFLFFSFCPLLFSFYTEWGLCQPGILRLSRQLFSSRLETG